MSLREKALASLLSSAQKSKVTTMNRDPRLIQLTLSVYEWDHGQGMETWIRHSSHFHKAQGQGLVGKQTSKQAITIKLDKCIYSSCIQNLMKTHKKDAPQAGRLGRVQENKQALTRQKQAGGGMEGQCEQMKAPALRCWANSTTFLSSHTGWGGKKLERWILCKDADVEEYTDSILSGYWASSQ